MRSVVGRLVLALLFFVAGAVLMSEARETRRLAGFHERLVTLQYERDNGDGADSPDDRRWWRPRFLGGGSGVDAATVQYWRHQYDALTDPAATGAQNETPDSERLFLAANAAFRATQKRPAGDRTMAVERLDRVVEAYASVLRASPGHADAAYNYEYVARSRDTLARGQKDKRLAKVAAAAPADPIPSPDLPVGPTLHGRPGGPPPDIPGSDFRMIAPMSFEEREESEPGQGPAPKRRG